MCPPRLVGLENVLLRYNVVQLIMNSVELFQMCSIDLASEYKGTITTGAWLFNIFTLYELGKVTLGRHQNLWLKLVLHLCESEDPKGQSYGADHYHCHSEHEALVAAPHCALSEFSQTSRH